MLWPYRRRKMNTFSEHDSNQPCLPWLTAQSRVPGPEPRPPPGSPGTSSASSSKPSPAARLLGSHAGGVPAPTADPAWRHGEGAGAHPRAAPRCRRLQVLQRSPGMAPVPGIHLVGFVVPLCLDTLLRLELIWESSFALRP
jgi:hypothetical protein